MNAKSLLVTMAALAIFAPMRSHAADGKPVEYKEGETMCEGYLVSGNETGKPAPGVLVVHDWMGLTDHTKSVCNELAAKGYVVMGADIYGKGVRPANREEAAAQAGKFKSDRALLRRRAEAALSQLKAAAGVDTSRLAAIGYCFGGTTVLELARDGAPIAGVVSFHGGLDSPNPADGKNIQAKVLVLHGADDPFVKKEDIDAFQQEMRAAKVDWQMNYYGNAVHAFTQPWAGDDNSKGAAYNAEAARRSWRAMNDFFAEVFRPTAAVAER